MSAMIHQMRLPPKEDAEDLNEQSRQVASEIRELLRQLPQTDRERILRDVSRAFVAVPAPRAGEVLGTIIRLLPQRRDWTVEDVTQEVASSGVEASRKEIYNALGYLTRKRYVRRIGYGRYLVEGMAIETSDEVGGDPTDGSCE